MDALVAGRMRFSFPGKPGFTHIACTEDFFHRVCSGHLAGVLNTLVYLRDETDVWFEITTSWRRPSLTRSATCSRLNPLARHPDRCRLACRHPDPNRRLHPRHTYLRPQDLLTAPIRQWRQMTGTNRNLPKWSRTTGSGRETTSYATTFWQRRDRDPARFDDVSRLDHLRLAAINSRLRKPIVRGRECPGDPLVLLRLRRRIACSGNRGFPEARPRRDCWPTRGHRALGDGRTDMGRPGGCRYCPPIRSAGACRAASAGDFGAPTRNPSAVQRPGGPWAPACSG